MVSGATGLLDAAVVELRGRLPEAWVVERSNRSIAQDTGEPQPLDGVIDIRAPNGTFTTIAVEVKQSFAPRDVERVLGGLARTLRTIAHNVPVLVVAPWLSARTQALLEAEDLNFVDVTGNVLVRLNNPALYLRSTGASRNPAPTPQGRARCVAPRPLASSVSSLTSVPRTAGERSRGQLGSPRDTCRGCLQRWIERRSSSARPEAGSNPSMYPRCCVGGLSRTTCSAATAREPSSLRPELLGLSPSSRRANGAARWP